MEYRKCINTNVSSNYLWTFKVTVISKLYSSLILLVIGGLIVRSQIVIGDECKGMLQAILFIPLIVLYAGTFIVTLIVQRVKGRPFNFYPFVTTVFVMIAIYFSFDQEMFKSKPTLVAETQTDNGSRLTLRENGTFLIQIREIEWSCFYHGEYQMRDDTLKLLRLDLQAVTHDKFVNGYVVERDKMLLRPLGLADPQRDRILVILTDQ